MELNWYHWKLSKFMWKMVRPLVKMYQHYNEDLGFDYNVSECYDDIDLGIRTTRKGYDEWDSTFHDMAREIEDFEKSTTDLAYERGFNRALAD